MKKMYLLIIFCLRSLSSLFAQSTFVDNHAFQPQEKISYNVYYNVVGIYVNAGSATFTTSSEKLLNEDVFHVVGEGLNESAL
jgi:hypothetical protein